MRVIVGKGVINKVQYTEKEHTFAICAYKESPYLEACIQSVKNQTILGNVIMVTSTPNNHIKKLAEQYGIPLYIKEGESDIADDWNFAYTHADTDLVTITHQDDIYCENYLLNVLKTLERAKKPLIFFSDYGEIRGKKIITSNTLLSIKKMLLFPLRHRMFWRSRFIRRRILSFGSAICCPSVTLVKTNLPKVVFERGYRSNIDWQAWERLSHMKGDFVYSNTVLMLHRIHQESETSKIIADSNRTKEDYNMYCKFWPRWIANILIKFYSKSQDSNTI